MTYKETRIVKPSEIYTEDNVNYELVKSLNTTGGRFSDSAGQWFQVVDFRPPEFGEQFIVKKSRGGCRVAMVLVGGLLKNEPRFIVKPVNNWGLYWE